MIIIALITEVVAISVLVYGIHVVLIDKDMGFCVGMVVVFLCLSSLSAIGFAVTYMEYQDAKLQNQLKILRQKVSDAEKDLQKYLIDHPELEVE